MRSFTVGRILGIPIRLSPTLLLFLPLLVWLIAGQIELYADLIDGISPIGIDEAAVTGGDTPIVIGIAAAVGLFVGVLLHELGHSVVAMRYDIPIASITLWIFGGLARMEDLPEDWSIEFWVAIAGPVTSVGVGAVCYAALFVLPASAPPVLVFVVAWLAVINVTLAVFNMLPAFPMDGGRVLRALLARRRPYVEATAIAAKVGRFFGGAMVILGILNLAPILALVGFFVYVAAGAESRVTALRAVLEDVTAADLLTGEPLSVPPDTSVQALLGRMLSDRRTGYPVTDADGTLLGIVSLPELTSVADGDRSSTTVADVMFESPPTVAPEDSAFAVFELLAETDADRVVVLEDGRVQGTIDNEAIVAYIELLQGIGPVATEEPEVAPPDGYA